jgi:hypothetical protein
MTFERPHTRQVSREFVRQSLKYSWLGSPEKLSSGRTAIERGRPSVPFSLADRKGLQRTIKAPAAVGRKPSSGRFKKRNRVTVGLKSEDFRTLFQVMHHIGWQVHVFQPREILKVAKMAVIR